MTKLVESVRGTKSKAFGAQASVSPGDTVLLRTVVPGSATKPQSVNIKLVAGLAKSLTVTAVSNGRSASAEVTSADGRPIELLHTQYVCTLPPLPTFCPAKRTISAGRGFKVTFATTAKSPILLQAVVGPVKLPTAPVRTATPSVVAPYRATELVAAVTRPAAGTPKGTAPKTTGLHASVSARPGDTVVMLTKLAGIPVGAPQTIKVTVDQGPARSIGVSAQVSGGGTSTATLQGVKGSRIALVLTHYSCSVDPARTFCPAQAIAAGHHRYTLTFLASPYTPPVVLIATAGAG